MFRYIGERTVAVIPVKRVLLPAGEENVLESVVVVVADGNAVKIARAKQARTLGHVGKRAVAVVFVKAIGGVARRIAETGAGENQDIEPAVVVVVEEGGPAAHGFQDIVGAPWVAGDYRVFQPGLLRDVRKSGVKRKSGELSARSRFHSAGRHPLASGLAPEVARLAKRAGEGDCAGFPKAFCGQNTSFGYYTIPAEGSPPPVSRESLKSDLPEYLESQFDLAAAVVR